MRSRYEALLSLVLIGLLPVNQATASTSAATLANGLPDSHLTPGALNPAVTQATIGSTICVAGWTKTVRPKASYTNALKRQQLSSGYNLGGDLDLRNYEEDHLVPLEIGGAPSDPKNLWPEPRHIARGASFKDKLENKLHLMICGGLISLKTARAVFQTNWEVGYQKYIGPLN
ncbi:MAG: hypothetical protein WCO08_00705 [Actinomycetes bacterium]